MRSFRPTTFFLFNSVILFMCGAVCPAPHSLTYILFGIRGTTDVPEFWAAAVVDDVQAGYCNSDTQRLEPQTSWFSTLLKKEPSHEKWLNNKCSYNRPDFIAHVKLLMDRFNQSEGVHIFQRMNGCQWDDETGAFSGFSHYGFDGEDFMSYDLETRTWIAPKHQGVVIKHEWDKDGYKRRFWEHALKTECRELLEMYLTYGKSSMQKTDPPSVSLLQKTPSSPVTCHATGFYPKTAELFWTKDKKKIHEGVTHGEIIPNHDGTFQKSVDLQISSVMLDEWKTFDCVFQFSGIQDKITTKLEKVKIRSNQSSSSRRHFGAGIGGFLFLIVCGTAFCCVRRRNVFRKKCGKVTKLTSNQKVTN